jgi:replicative DNA helicase
MKTPTHHDEEQVLTRTLPSNILAEQVLLGAILTNNELIHRINDILLAEHFHEPVNYRIYSAINVFMERGLIANPVTLKNYFDKDEALKEVGGAEYLVRLSALATTIINVVDYAKTVQGLAFRRNLIAIGEDMVNDAYDKEIELTASEQIEQAEQKLYELASDGIDKSSGFQPLKTSLTEAINKAQIAFKQKEKITGISSGFIEMDRLLGGFHNSDLLILAGRPSMGKTALAVNLALNAVQNIYERHLNNNKNKEQLGVIAEAMPSVGFFSLEMSSEQLASRMLSMMSGISSSKMRNGHITEDEFKKVLSANKLLYQLPFYIDDTPALSISSLRTRARRLKRRHNLKLLVVDYLQLVKGVSKHGTDNRVQEVSEITQGLKAIAKELNIPVIALSQLSRAVEQREDKRPLLSDLRESGSIEQDADIVMFIFREEYYIMRKEPRHDTPEHITWLAEMEAVASVTEVIVAKQRNGPIGMAKLQFDAHLTRFNNLVNE